jgi:hypothetical protein
MNDRQVTIYKGSTIWQNVNGYYYTFTLKNGFYERIASDSLNTLKTTINKQES